MNNFDEFNDEKNKENQQPSHAPSTIDEDQVKTAETAIAQPAAAETALSEQNEQLHAIHDTTQPEALTGEIRDTCEAGQTAVDKTSIAAAAIPVETMHDQEGETLQTEELQKDADPMDVEMQQVQEEAPTPKAKKKKAKKDPFLKRHKSGAILTGCFVLAGAGAFGGTMAAQFIGKKAGVTGTVLYQSVEKTQTTNTSSGDSSALSVQEVAAAVGNSVVEIKTESVSTNSYFQQAVESGAGSGVILSTDGYIVTNNHVINGASKITVTTHDGTAYEATLVGTDSQTDLAVLKIDTTDLTPVVLGTSGSLQVGDTAIAIGNPLGELGGTVTSGIISALDREITIDNQKMHLLQTSAAINPGNSGGGLFNSQGELIGIVNAKSSGTGVEGLGFAIPVDRAKEIITNLIENGYVTGRAALGVTLTEGQSTNPFATSGSAQVYIAKVESGKAADQAGLKAGDQVLKADGVDITSVSDLKTAISEHKAGEKITLTILRDSETTEITVTLGEATQSTSSQSNQSSNSQNQLPNLK